MVVLLIDRAPSVGSIPVTSQRLYGMKEICVIIRVVLISSRTTGEMIGGRLWSLQDRRHLGVGGRGQWVFRWDTWWTSPPRIMTMIVRDDMSIHVLWQWQWLGGMFTMMAHDMPTTITWTTWWRQHIYNMMHDDMTTMMTTIMMMTTMMMMMTDYVRMIMTTMMITTWLPWWWRRIRRWPLHDGRDMLIMCLFLDSCHSVITSWLHLSIYSMWLLSVQPTSYS